MTPADPEDTLVMLRRSRAPYPGLRPFEESEEDLFFGRGEQIDRMLRTLERHRFLGVVGGSGCGKSSLVRAGLLPAVRGGFLSQAGADWKIAVLRPGDRPMTRLAEALHTSTATDGSTDAGVGAEAVALTEATLFSGSRGLVEALNELSVPADVETLVVVDQFEEVFRFRRATSGGNDAPGRAGASEARNEAGAFIGLLLASAKQSERPIRIVVTMRSDYFGDCEEFAGLPEAMSAGQFLVARMTREEIRLAIEGPLKATGAEAEPALVNRTLNDIGTDPDQLPLMQHALLRLWVLAGRRAKADGSRTCVLRLEDYERLGSVARALANHAEEVLESLGSSRLRTAERLLEGLCELEPGGKYVRRWAQLGDLVSESGESLEDLKAVVEAYRKPGRNFLVASPAGDLGPGTSLDIAHEALIRRWPRLRRWADLEKESVEWIRRLTRTSHDWRAGKSALWRPPDLTLARAWQESRRPTSAWAAKRGGDLPSVVEFLQASRRGLVRRKTAIYAAIGTALVAVFAVVLLGMKSKAATERREATEVLSLEMAANDALTLDPMRALILANEAVRRSNKVESMSSLRQALSSLRQALMRSLERLELLGHTGRVTSLSYSPDGRWILTGSDDHTARLWDPLWDERKSESKGKKPVEFIGHKEIVRSAVFSPDGTRVLTASDDFTARLWDLNGKQLRVLGDPALEAEGHAKAVRSAVFSRDGKQVLTASDDHTARRWDVGTGKQLALLKGHDDAVNTAVFSPDGTKILTASSDMTARVWSLDGQELRRLEGHRGKVNTACFSPDGTRILTGSADNTAMLWDLEGKGTPPHVFKGHVDSVRTVAFLNDGRKVPSVLTGSFDGTARLWTFEDGAWALPTIFRGHTGPIWTAAFWFEPTPPAPPRGGPRPAVGRDETEDRTRILTASGDGTARLWTLGGTTIATLRGHEDTVFAVAVSPDGSNMATASGDKTVRLWDLTGSGLPSMRGHDGFVTSVAFSPDESKVLTASADKTARLWDAKTGRRIAILRGHGAAVNSAVFSRHGTTILTASADNTARLWDLGGNQLKQFDDFADTLSSAVFSPDTTRLLAGTFDGKAKLWDPEGKDPPIVLTPHSDSVKSAVFSPHGTTILTASRDKTAVLWDLRGNPPTTFKGHTATVYRAVFSPDGSKVLTASGDGTACLWDLRGKKLDTFERHDGGINSAIFSPDGSKVLTASNDHTARLCDLVGEKFGRESAIFEGHEGSVTSVAFSPVDGTRILTGSTDGTAQLWLATESQADIRKRAEARITRGLTRHECEKYCTFKLNECRQYSGLPSTCP